MVAACAHAVFRPRKTGNRKALQTAVDNPVRFNKKRIDSQF